MLIYIDINISGHALPDEQRRMLYEKCRQVIFPMPDVYRYLFHSAEIRDIVANELMAKNVEFKKSGE
jgi:hypothetical protein